MKKLDIEPMAIEQQLEVALEASRRHYKMYEDMKRISEIWEDAFNRVTEGGWKV